jgi:hypothetical protein
MTIFEFYLTYNLKNGFFLLKVILINFILFYIFPAFQNFYHFYA